MRCGLSFTSALHGNASAMTKNRGRNSEISFSRTREHYIVVPEKGILAWLANRAMCDKTWYYCRYDREHLKRLFESW
jgi:hypothetical protein